MLKLGDVFPSFRLDSTYGIFDLYDHLAGSWGMVFSHPADYTPVCTTELGMAANYHPVFKEVRTNKKVLLGFEPTKK